MSPSEFRLSRWQLVVLVFMVTLCVTPFVFDATLMLYLGPNAWMALLPALGVGLVATVLALALSLRFPGASVVDWAPRVLGSVGGRVYLGLLGVLLLAGAPANAHVVTRLVSLTELPHTPHFATAAVLTAVVAYGCYFGPEVVARMGEVLAAVVAVGLAVIFVAPLSTALPVRLLPMGGFSWSHYLAPLVVASWGSVRGFLCVLVLGGVADEQRGMAWPALLAVLAAWVLLELSLVEPVMILGAGLSEHVRFPMLAVTGTVGFRWLPFQRLTTITILIWEMMMYVVLGFYLWSGVYVLAGAFGSRSWRVWLPFGAVATAYLGGVSAPPATSRMLTDLWNGGVIVIGLGASVLLLTADRVRRRMGARSS